MQGLGGGAGNLQRHPAVKPWRERLARAGVHTLSPEQSERLDREDKAHFAAIEVFGNEADAGRWFYGSTSEFGGWQAPDSVATASDEGLARVLARLDEMRATVTPRPDPFPTTLAARRRKRRDSTR